MTKNSNRVTKYGGMNGINLYRNVGNVGNVENIRNVGNIGNVGNLNSPSDYNFGSAPASFSLIPEQSHKSHIQYGDNLEQKITEYMRKKAENDKIFQQKSTEYLRKKAEKDKIFEQKVVELNVQREEKRKLDEAEFSKLYSQPNSRDNMVAILNDALKSITDDVTLDMIRTVENNLSKIRNRISPIHWQDENYQKLKSVIHDLTFITMFPGKGVNELEQQKLFMISRNLQDFAKEITSDPKIFMDDLVFHLNEIRKRSNVQKNIEKASLIVNFLGTHASVEILLNDMKKYSAVMGQEYNIDMLDTIDERLKMPGSGEIESSAYQMPTTPSTRYSLLETDNVDNEMYETLVNLYKVIVIVAISIKLVKWLSRWNIMPGTRMILKRKRNGYFLTGKDMYKKNVSIRIIKPSILIQEAMKNNDLEMK